MDTQVTVSLIKLFFIGLLLMLAIALAQPRVLKALGQGMLIVLIIWFVFKVLIEVGQNL